MAEASLPEEISVHQTFDESAISPEKPARRPIAALYMRVSTANKHQTCETQAVALREYAQQRGYQILEYADTGISGSKNSRPSLDKLMRDARTHKFDLVIVARFDRFARSTAHLLRALDEFQQLGVDFVSLTENINTGTAVGKMTFTVLSALAELERNLIKERVQMGIARARKQGRQLGRPLRVWDRDQARSLLAAGLSLREVSRQLRVPRTVLTRGLQAK